MLVELASLGVALRHETDHDLGPELAEWVVETHMQELTVEPVRAVGGYVHIDARAVPVVVKDACNEIPIALEADALRARAIEAPAVGLNPGPHAGGIIGYDALQMDDPKKLAAELQELKGAVAVLTVLLRATWAHPKPVHPEVVVQQIRDQWVFSNMSDEAIKHAERMLREFLSK